MNNADYVIKWTKNLIEDQHIENVIIGISGGKDSTIVAAILAKVLGPEHVIGVSIPNGVQKDIKDVDKVFETLGITRHTINIGKAYCGLIEQIEQTSGKKANSIVKTNTPARLRMTVLYMVGAMYPNSRVVNTCNASEDYIGWSTKYGDSAGDFSLFANFTVTEILEIGDALGLPYELVHKTPDDGMSGRSDEDNFGFTYAELDNWIRYGIKGENYDKIERMHKASRHKYLPMPCVEMGEE